MAFRVGQKVVCVNDGKYAGDSANRWSAGCEIFKGNIYTIREIGITVTGENGLKLQEVALNTLRGGLLYEDTFYRAARFRLVAEKKTDISVFTAMLDKTPEHVG